MPNEPQDAENPVEPANMKAVNDCLRCALTAARFGLATIALGMLSAHWPVLEVLAIVLLLAVPVFAILSILKGLLGLWQASPWGGARGGAGNAAAGIGLSALVLVFWAVALRLPHSLQWKPPRPVRSLNKMKQLAIAVEQYTMDYDGRFPGWVRNPDGRLAHNVWDEQIDVKVRSKDVYSNGDTGIRSPSDPRHARVLTYGFNGLLLTPQKPRFDGNADWSRPAPRTFKMVSDPANTILFAELETDAPMPRAYGRVDPIPFSGQTKAPAGKEWQLAQPGWIDIDPRNWVENNGSDSYDPDKSPGWGVARSLYGGGGNYAFTDGHAKFMKLSETVGLGEKVPGLGTIQPGQTAWSPKNPNNLWNPDK